jgi:methyltransferase (TIGR00027 family)
MRKGRESQTSVFVAVGRAIAHGTTSVAGFSDPTAMTLLPEAARADVERFRAGPPRGLRARFGYEFMDRRSKVMVVRTVAIDAAIREHPAPQLVILGAGLDGRAWRMPELRDTVAFEVDHPDTQREKRARAAPLAPVARAIHFVPVDFTRDDLAAALAGAGHDAARPTTWIWEGVVMYLTAAEIDATLAVIKQRSTAGSRLIIAYHSPALLLALVGLVVRGVGEPLRSVHTPEKMRALLAANGFEVRSDQDVRSIGAALGPDVAAATRVIKHLRIVVADR